MSGQPDIVAPPSQVLYVFVRADLPVGVMIAQTAHAVAEGLGHPPMVVRALAVPNEDALRALHAKLAGRDVAGALVIEDAGPFAGQATAIGLPPTTDCTAIRKVSSHLPLAGK